MEESPEQVLARLARHRDSLIGANRLPPATERPPPASAPVGRWPADVPRIGVPRPPAGPPPAAGPAAGQPTPTEFIPPSVYSSAHGWRPSQSAVLVTLLGLVSAVVACMIAVLVFAKLDTNPAYVVVGSMAVAGLIAAARRLPVAMWWTVGVAVGAALGRWS
ncbi:MAG TPA: hypothetical protein VGP92_03055 [Acidimicrobiia bacterium]|nr:hypothetical protein [Acidimicrobiia bacterium]